MTISVTVDGQGKLVAVSVNRTWRRDLSAEDFAGALFARYLEALQEWLVEQLSRRLAEPPRRGEPRPPDPDRNVLTEARATIEQARDVVRVLKDGGGSDETTEIRSGRGYLTLRTRAGGAVGLTGNVAAIDKANAELLAQDAMDVFRRANLTAP